MANGESVSIEPEFVNTFPDIKTLLVKLAHI